ncbi:MAG: oxygen-dependent protoporphyrinogen oxidase [Nitriliruptoraceae bacterium]|jgi:oxygen-dependent protoporphyrinogen oxidase
MKVVVVGGGIAGLTAAWTVLHGPHDDPTPRRDAHVTVLEASPHVGGKLRTGSLDGSPFDLGAEAFLARRPEATRLVHRLGLQDQLTQPAQSGVHLWLGDRLRRYPARTVFGVPTDAAALAASGVVSDRTVARVIAEQLRDRPASVHDASVADVLTPLVGREVVDVLVEPLLGGVYAGSVDRLSIRSAAAVLATAAAQPGSFINALRGHQQRTAHLTSPVFSTLTQGMGGLVAALARDLDIRTQVAAVALEPAGAGWRVHTTDGVLDADHVVIAIPSHPAAELLAPVAPVSATALRAVPYATSAVVATAWPASAGTLPAGSGMLVPRGEDRLVKAATWSSSKWEHVGGRDATVIRFSVGRVDDRRAAMLEDRILSEIVLTEGREALGLTGEPLDVVVQRWPDGLPQYDVGHDRRVAAIRQGLPAGVHVTGAVYSGVGVAPTVGHAEQVAATIRVATA